MTFGWFKWHQLHHGMVIFENEHILCGVQFMLLPATQTYPKVDWTSKIILPNERNNKETKPK